MTRKKMFIKIRFWNTFSHKVLFAMREAEETELISPIHKDDLFLIILSISTFPRWKPNREMWSDGYLLVRKIAVESLRFRAVPGGDVVVS